MDQYSSKELGEAQRIISSVVGTCEEMLPKFVEGTSQHSLLKNRIKALNISNALIKHEDILGEYSREELSDALQPVLSIISKCEKAQLKFLNNTSSYIRLKNMIRAMNISKTMIVGELSKRG